MAVHFSYLGLPCLGLTQSIPPAARHLTEDDVGPMVARWKQVSSRITGHPVPIVPRCLPIFPRSYHLRLPGVLSLWPTSAFPKVPKVPNDNYLLNTLKWSPYGPR